MLALVLLPALLAAPPLPAPTPAGPLDAEAAFLASRREVSLVEAMRLADARSPDLVAARAAAQAVAAKAKLVFSAALPEISAGVSYVHTTGVQQFSTAQFAGQLAPLIGASIRGAGAAYGLAGNAAQVDAVVQATQDQFVASAKDIAPTVIVGADSLYGNVLVSQVLFSPQLLLIPAASESKEAARLGALEAREQVLLGVAKVYLGAQGLGQLEQAARDAEAVALKREKDARSQAQAGVATDLAVLRAQQETAAARAQLASLSGQRVALVALLEALVGEAVRPLDTPAPPLEVTAADEARAPWEASFLLRSTARALKSQETFNTFDRLSWLPSLVAQAKGSYNSNKGFADTNFFFDAIVAAQWTLYDRGQRYVAMHENDARTVELRARLEGERAKARATWVGARAGVESAEVALAQAEAQAALAARAQQQVESAARAGFTTSLELSDVDAKRFLAAAAVASARAQLQLKKAELAAAEGRLAAAVGLE